MVPTPANSGGRCSAEWSGLQAAARTADYYCSLEPSIHTDNLCNTALDNYDAAQDAYNDCEARDATGPQG